MMQFDGTVYHTIAPGTALAGTTMRKGELCV